MSDSIDYTEHDHMAMFPDRSNESNISKATDIAIGVFIISGVVEAIKNRDDFVGCAKGIGKAIAGVVVGNTFTR